MFSWGGQSHWSNPFCHFLGWGPGQEKEGKSEAKHHVHWEGAWVGYCYSYIFQVSWPHARDQHQGGWECAWLWEAYLCWCAQSRFQSYHCLPDRLCGDVYSKKQKAHIINLLVEGWQQSFVPIPCSHLCLFGVLDCVTRVCASMCRSLPCCAPHAGVIGVEPSIPSGSGGQVPSCLQPSMPSGSGGQDVQSSLQPSMPSGSGGQALTSCMQPSMPSGSGGEALPSSLQPSMPSGSGGQALPSSLQPSMPSGSGGQGAPSCLTSGSGAQQKPEETKLVKDEQVCLCCL